MRVAAGRSEALATTSSRFAPPRNRIRLTTLTRAPARRGPDAARLAAAARRASGTSLCTPPEANATPASRRSAAAAFPSQLLSLIPR